MISPKRIIGGSLSNVTSWVMTDPPRKTSQELGQWEAGVGEGRSARARWIEGTREGRKKERKKETQKETLLSSCIKAEPLNIFSSLIVETTKRFFFVNYKGFGSFRYLFSCFRVFQIFPNIFPLLQMGICTVSMPCQKGFSAFWKCEREYLVFI